jgi:hypothetical protein
MPSTLPYGTYVAPNEEALRRLLQKWARYRNATDFQIGCASEALRELVERQARPDDVVLVALASVVAHIEHGNTGAPLEPDALADRRTRAIRRAAEWMAAHHRSLREYLTEPARNSSLENERELMTYLREYYQDYA